MLRVSSRIIIFENKMSLYSTCLFQFLFQNINPLVLQYKWMKDIRFSEAFSWERGLHCLFPIYKNWMLLSIRLPSCYWEVLCLYLLSCFLFHIRPVWVSKKNDHNKLLIFKCVLYMFFDLLAVWGNQEN